MNFEKRWTFALAVAAITSIFLFAASVSSLHKINSFFPKFNTRIVNKTSDFAPPPGPIIPRFAYLVSGSKGDLNKLWRTVSALYHPWNYYVLRLDLESSVEERAELVSRVESDPVFKVVGNVYVVKKSNMVTYRGPTMVSNTLHACAILLKKFKDWDWFINLSASDYPLVTQDGTGCCLFGECGFWLVC